MYNLANSEIIASSYKWRSLETLKKTNNNNEMLLLNLSDVEEKYSRVPNNRRGWNNRGMRGRRGWTW